MGLGVSDGLEASGVFIASVAFVATGSFFEGRGSILGNSFLTGSFFGPGSSPSESRSLRAANLDCTFGGSFFGAAAYAPAPSAAGLTSRSLTLIAGTFFSSGASAFVGVTGF